MDDGATADPAKGDGRQQPFIPNQDALGITGATPAGGTLLMPRAYNLILPGDDDIYGVKDEQLANLVSGGRTKSLDYCLAAGGIAAGYVPAGLDTYEKLVTSTPLTGGDVFFGVIFVACVVISILTFMHHRQTAKNTGLLEQRIRSGQKLRVGPDAH